MRLSTTMLVLTLAAIILGGFTYLTQPEMPTAKLQSYGGSALVFGILAVLGFLRERATNHNLAAMKKRLE